MTLASRLTLVTLMTLIAPATMAMAAGESGGEGGGNSMLFNNPTPKASEAPPPQPAQGAKPQKKETNRGTPICGVGYAMQKGTCVRVKAGIMPDDELYQQGRVLALAGYHAHALPILDAVTRSDSAMVWTMRGYATRKLGRFEEGMALYEKALAIDPANVNTHEYKGEAFVTIGQIDKAKAELAIVESLCGKSCEQYEDLAEAIETGHDED